MRELLQVWTQLREIGASLSIAFEPGATSESISAAERKLNRGLQSNLVELLRTTRSWGWREAEFDAVMFLPPEDIAEFSIRPRNRDLVLQVEESLTPRVRPLVYAPSRTTFARTDYLYFQIDDDPLPGGRVGQIVSIDFGEGLVDVVAESLEAFVARGLECIRSELRGGYPEQTPVNPVVATAAAQIAVPTIEESSLPPVKVATTRKSKPVRGPRAETPMAAAQISYESWLASVLPEGSKRFKRGATAKVIRQFLSNEGYALADLLFESYASYNGQAATKTPLLPPAARMGLGLVWLPFDDAAYSYSNQPGLVHLFDRSQPLFASSPPGVKNGFWRKGWWPIARTSLDESRFDCMLFVDLDPAPGGTQGQLVISVLRNENGRFVDGQRKVVASSLTAYFQQLTADAAAGRLAFRHREGVVWVD